MERITYERMQHEKKVEMLRATISQLTERIIELQEISNAYGLRDELSERIHRAYDDRRANKIMLADEIKP